MNKRTTDTTPQLGSPECRDLRWDVLWAIVAAIGCMLELRWTTEEFPYLLLLWFSFVALWYVIWLVIWFYKRSLRKAGVTSAERTTILPRGASEDNVMVATIAVGTLMFVIVTWGAAQLGVPWLLQPLPFCATAGILLGVLMWKRGLAAGPISTGLQLACIVILISFLLGEIWRAVNG